MRVSSGSNILHGYVHNDYIVNNNLTIFRCINNEGLIVIKPYVSRFVTLLKDRQGYVRPEWRHFLIAPVVFFVRHSIDTDNLPFPFQDYFQPSFCLVIPCIEDLHNISCKDEGVVSVCGLSEINGSEPISISGDFLKLDLLAMKKSCLQSTIVQLPYLLYETIVRRLHVVVFVVSIETNTTVLVCALSIFFFV